MNYELIKALTSAIPVEKEYLHFEKISRTRLDDYVQSKCTEPQKKEIKYPSAVEKSSLIKNAVIFAIAVVTTVIFLIFAISTISKSSSAKDIAANPGYEYENWVSKWEEVNSFDDLEASWDNVEKNWASRGIDVDWNFVKDFKEQEYRSGIIYADNFSSKFLKKVESEYYSDGMDFVYIFLSIITVALGIIFGKKSYDELLMYKYSKEKYDKEFMEAEKNKSYNNTEYPKLLADYKDAYNKALEDYPVVIENASKESCKAYSQLVSICPDFAKIYPEDQIKNYSKAESLIKILESDRADDFDEALVIHKNNVLEAEKSIDYMLSEIRKNTDEIESTIHQAQENLKRRQKEESEEEWRQRKARENKCRHCAHNSKCRIYWGTTGDAAGCASYLPK